MKKLSILICLIVSSFTALAQYEVKTIKRPDGITLKYFNPIPVIRTSNYEAGLSLYKNSDNDNYFVTITVLFKKNQPEELTGNLIIQTTGKKGLSLNPVYNKLLDMNGRDVAVSMYYLTDSDTNELKNNLLKLISFNVNDKIIALNINENNNVLFKEFSILKNENNNTKNLKIKPDITYKPSKEINPPSNQIDNKSANISSGKDKSLGNLDQIKNNLENEKTLNDNIEKSNKLKFVGFSALFVLIFLMITYYNNKAESKIKTKKTIGNKTEKEYKNSNSMLDIYFEKLKEDAINSIKNKIRFDGLYIGSQIFINQHTQRKNKYIAIFKFNENGLGIYTDFIEENIETKISLDMLRKLKNELSKINKYEPFEGIARYEVGNNDEIKLKYFDPNYKNNFDENNYHTWSGKILIDKLILSRDEFFYSYDRNCVVRERIFDNIEFSFLNLK